MRELVPYDIQNQRSSDDWRRVRKLFYQFYSCSEKCSIHNYTY